jgi:hypothetical protein
VLGIAHAERLAVGDDDAGLFKGRGFIGVVGGCWRVRKVTCPKSNARFQLSAQDMRARPVVSSGSAATAAASRTSCR